MYNDNIACREFMQFNSLHQSHISEMIDDPVICILIFVMENKLMRNLVTCMGNGIFEHCNSSSMLNMRHLDTCIKLALQKPG